MAQSWSAERFAPGGEQPAGASVVRFRGPRGPLSAPMLVWAEGDDGNRRQLKIVFGETPMLYLEVFDDGDVAALTQAFVEAARTLTQRETDSPMRDGLARAVAADLLRRWLLGR